MVVSAPVSAMGGIAGVAVEPGDASAVAELVARAKAGDGEAFALLYKQYLDQVYRFAYFRLGEREAAEDATQTVFFRAFAALPTCRENAAFAGWLFAIARGVVIDRLRSRRFGTEPLDAASHSADGSLDPEALALQGEAIRTLRAARQSCLTERERELLDLLLTEMNDKEIAAVLGKSHGAVRTAHWRLVAKLRDCLAAATGVRDEGRRDG